MYRRVEYQETVLICFTTGWLPSIIAGKQFDMTSLQNVFSKQLLNLFECFEFYFPKENDQMDLKSVAMKDDLTVAVEDKHLLYMDWNWVSKCNITCTLFDQHGSKIIWTYWNCFKSSSSVSFDILLWDCFLTHECQ